MMIIAILLLVFYDVIAVYVTAVQKANDHRL